MKKIITRTYIFNWKSILLLTVIAIVLILFGFVQFDPVLSNSFGTTMVLLIVLSCLGFCFYSNFYTRESSTE